MFMREEIDSRRITQLNVARKATENIASNNYELMTKDSTYYTV